MRILGTFFTAAVIFMAGNAYAGETHSLLFGDPEPPTVTTPPLELSDPEPSVTSAAHQQKTSILQTDLPPLPGEETEGEAVDEETAQETDAADVSCLAPCYTQCAAPCRLVWRCGSYMPRHCGFRCFQSACAPCPTAWNSACLPVMTTACEPACAPPACAPIMRQYRKITKEITYEVKVPYQELCTRTYLVEVPQWEMRPMQVTHRVYAPTACVPTACARPVSACEAVEEAEVADADEIVAADCVLRTHTVMKPFCTMVPQERIQQYMVWKWRTEIRKCIVEEIVCD